MVRLAALMLIALLSACTHGPSLPETTALSIEALDEGEHSPALGALFAQAENARRAKALDNAQSYLEQARQIEPRNSETLYRKAWLFMQMNQPEAAEKLSQRALIFAAPNSPVARRLHWLLAQALSAQGKMMDAYVHEQQALGH